MLILSEFHNDIHIGLLIAKRIEILLNKASAAFPQLRWVHHILSNLPLQRIR